MRKNNQIVISLGIVLVAALSHLNKTLASSKKKKFDYSKALHSIKEEKFADAKKSFDNLQGYKNTNTMLLYVRALEELKRNPPDYALIVNYLRLIETNYNGDLSNEIRELRSQANRNETALSEQKKIVELFKKETCVHKQSQISSLNLQFCMSHTCKNQRHNLKQVGQQVNSFN